MPIIPPRITRPEHVVEFLHNYLLESTLPLEYIARYDEALIPKYPAALVMSGSVQKEIHGTHTWLLTLRAEIFIMHARLTESRVVRNYEDLKLATEVVELLERDLTLGNKIIAGWVESETPGAMPPRNSKGAAVISTRLLWAGTTEARF